MNRKQFTNVVELIDEIFINEGKKVQVELAYKVNGESQTTSLGFCKRDNLSNVTNENGDLIACFCHMEEGDEAPSMETIEQMLVTLELGCKLAYKGITGFNDTEERKRLDEEVKINNLSLGSIGI